MSLELTYFRTGSTALWQGKPLLFSCRLFEDDLDRSLISYVSSSFNATPVVARLFAVTYDEDSGERSIEPAYQQDMFVGSAGQYCCEIQTEMLEAGEYLINVESGEVFGDVEVAWYPENIWVLDPSSYLDLWSERTDLPLEQGQFIRASDSERFVSDLLFTNLGGSAYGFDGFRPSYDRWNRRLPWTLTFEPYGFEDLSLYALERAPQRWLTEGLADELRQVTAHGVHYLQFHLKLGLDKFILRAEGELLEPLSEGCAKAVRDSELRELSLLGASTDLRYYLPTIQVKPGERGFMMQVECEHEARGEEVARKVKPYLSPSVEADNGVGVHDKSGVILVTHDL